MFAHLVPQGSPFALSPFMVLIEVISRLIRPLTLAIRLSANMIAGHLLMVLLRNVAVGSSGGVCLFVISILVALLTLELRVSLIQAYVFRVLSVLYVNEVREGLD